MGINTRIVDNEVILEPRDSVTGILKRTIDESMRQSHHRRFIVDLRHISLLDSDGLAELVRAYTAVRRQGGSLILVNLADRIQEHLMIAGLTFLFERAEGDEQAGIASRLKPREPLDGQAVSLPIPVDEPERH